MTKLTREEALELLNAIGTTDEVVSVRYYGNDDFVTVPVDAYDWEKDGWWDDIEFTTKLGHKVLVYNDSGGWDNIVEVSHADGREWDGVQVSWDDEVYNWKPNANATGWGLNLDVGR